MARYRGPRERIERRLGEKLNLKGERSRSPKSAMTKRPFPPGVHGQNFRRKISEFGQQLQSKQKVRNIYRLMERQFKAYIKKAVASHHNPYEEIIRALEQRLDNVVFRMGFAQSRDQARQLVGHGHILVNGKKVNIPSYSAKVGDVVSIREGSKANVFMNNLMPVWLKNYDAPVWISLDKEAYTAKIQGQPAVEESGVRPEDIQAIIEYYSR